MIKIKKKTGSLFSQHKKEILMILSATIFIFDILTEIPYVNLVFRNIFVKSLLVWLLAIAVFKIKYTIQTKIVLGLLSIMPFFVFMGSKSYDYLGISVYLLIFVLAFSAIVSKE